MNRLINIARASALAGMVSGCVVFAAPAFAADGDAPPQGTIAVRGADFTSPRAIAHLKHQLRHVATDICVPNLGARLMNRDERACYETALKDGQAQIDNRQQQAMRDRTVLLANTRADGSATH